jgi:hypothetical protein
MIALVCFVLAVLASPFKSSGARPGRSRLRRGRLARYRQLSRKLRRRDYLQALTQ